jgi:hypothetical protein
VTLTLADEIDVSRGDVLVAADEPPAVADQFEATVVWMDDEPCCRAAPYLLKIGARMVGASVTEIKHRVNVNTLEHLAAKKLELNEIGVVQPVAGPGHRLRALRREPRPGRLHPDRPDQQPHRRGRHAELRPAPGRHNIHWQAPTSARPRGPR